MVSRFWAYKVRGTYLSVTQEFVSAILRMPANLNLTCFSIYTIM